MNETIEVRDEDRPRQAWLYQQGPDAIIAAAGQRTEIIAIKRPTITYFGGTRVGGFIDPLLHLPLTGARNVVLLTAYDHSTGAFGIGDSETSTADVKPYWFFSRVGWERCAESVDDTPSFRGRKEKPQRLAAGSLRVRRLSDIQSTLGVSTQSFAEMLAVSRAALYKWLDASKAISLQEGSRFRLAAVERIADAWRRRSPASLGTVAHELLANGQTIHKLLTADPLNEQAVIGAFDDVLARLQAKPKSLSQKMAEAGFRRRPSRRTVSDDE